MNPILLLYLFMLLLETGCSNKDLKHNVMQEGQLIFQSGFENDSRIVPAGSEADLVGIDQVSEDEDFQVLVVRRADHLVRPEFQPQPDLDEEIRVLQLNHLLGPGSEGMGRFAGLEDRGDHGVRAGDILRPVREGHDGSDDVDFRGRQAAESEHEENRQFFNHNIMITDFFGKYKKLLLPFCHCE